jgi:hypothetical protein
MLMLAHGNRVLAASIRTRGDLPKLWATPFATYRKLIARSHVGYWTQSNGFPLFATVARLAE